MPDINNLNADTPGVEDVTDDLSLMSVGSSVDSAASSIFSNQDSAEQDNTGATDYGDLNGAPVNTPPPPTGTVNLAANIVPPGSNVHNSGTATAMAQVMPAAAPVTNPIPAIVHGNGGVFWRYQGDLVAQASQFPMSHPTSPFMNSRFTFPDGCPEFIIQRSQDGFHPICQQDLSHDLTALVFAQADSARLHAAMAEIMRGILVLEYETDPGDNGTIYRWKFDKHDDATRVQKLIDSFPHTITNRWGYLRGTYDYEGFVEIELSSSQVHPYELYRYMELNLGARLLAGLCSQVWLYDTKMNGSLSTCRIVAKFYSISVAHTFVAIHQPGLRLWVDDQGYGYEANLEAWFYFGPPNGQPDNGAPSSFGGNGDDSPLSPDTESHHENGGSGDTAPGSQGNSQSENTSASLVGYFERSSRATRDHAFARHTVKPVEITSGVDCRTTVMMRAIRYDLLQDQLIAWLSSKCKGLFDFVYLRMDFAAHRNVGYAFINFTQAKHILELLELVEENPSISQKSTSKTGKQRKVRVSYATIQGTEALITKFRNSSVSQVKPEWRPKLLTAYHSDEDIGKVEVGLELSFPEPDNRAKLIRSQQNQETFGLYQGRRPRGKVASVFDNGSPRNAKKQESSSLGAVGDHL